MKITIYSNHYIILRLFVIFRGPSVKIIYQITSKLLFRIWHWKCLFKAQIILHETQNAFIYWPQRHYCIFERNKNYSLFKKTYSEYYMILKNETHSLPVIHSSKKKNFRERVNINQLLSIQKSSTQSPIISRVFSASDTFPHVY